MCPADWTVTAIELAMDGSATVMGNNSEVMNEYRVGSCGGGGATEVYSFVANAAGTYVVHHVGSGCIGYETVYFGCASATA